jgi:hypothetical protein
MILEVSKNSIGFLTSIWVGGNTQTERDSKEFSSNSAPVRIQFGTAMSTPGSVPPELELLATTATETILSGIDHETTTILQQSATMIKAAEHTLTEELDHHHSTVLAKLEAKESRGWQFAIALVPTIATALLGLLVFWLQIDTNKKIDRASKQLSTRLSLSQQFYQQRFTIYDDSDKRMVRLLAAVRNLDRNPNDADKKKQAAILLIQLNVSSRTNSFYMTKEVSDGLANVWLVATELPQLNNGGTKQIEDLDATIKRVEEQMRKELLVNIESVEDER